MGEKNSRELLINPEKENWKNYTVGVMGASSDKNIEALVNGYEVGKVLAELGYDVANGGYAVGGMGKTAEGFQEVLRNKGFDDQEIGDHFQAVVLSEEAIGKKLASQRKYINPATRHEYDDFTSRSGGIINRSDAVIALPGGIGTGIETNASAMGEWFRQRKRTAGEGEPYRRPIIIIDSKNTVVKDMTLFEAESPGTIDTVSDDIYVLAGHKLPSGEVANLANDPGMREELKMILEVYQMFKDSEKTFEEASTEDAKSKLNARLLEIQDSIKRFVTLKDVVARKKELFKNLGEDWGTK